MQQKNTFAISFYLRKDKADDKKTAPIFMRVTVNGERADISINRKIETNKWKDGGLKSPTSDTEFTMYLDSLKSKVYDIRRDLIDRNELISADKIKNRYLGKDTSTKTVLEVFEYHNKQMKELIGKDFSFGTLQRYEVTLKHVKEFMLKKYGCKDMLLSELKYEFLSSFDHYLKTEKSCESNTTAKYIKNFKKIIHLALKNEWLKVDPFRNFSVKTKEVERGFLTQEELNAIEQKAIKIERLAIVRDIFVFSCYTGLAFSDVAKLSNDHIKIGIDGEMWIHLNRTKTDNKSIIPLLPKAIEKLEKYKNHPKVQASDKLLPVPINQKMNAYLKELADICDITKNLTFHLARHTFATTVTLTNGVPIETVSAMLGHKSIKTTQIYSKVVEQKVSSDMAALKQKLLLEKDVRQASLQKTQ